MGAGGCTVKCVMPPTLAALVQNSALRLSVLAGHGGLDATVRWAHSSELADPTPYMDGGELILFTGLKLDADDRDAMRAYVDKLVGKGVVGLGFAAGVNYEGVPQALVDACRGADLPLLEVPRRTPFIAISKAVSADIAAEQYRAVSAGFDAQREMTRAALSREGLGAARAAGLAGRRVGGALRRLRVGRRHGSGLGGAPGDPLRRRRRRAAAGPAGPRQRGGQRGGTAAGTTGSNSSRSAAGAVPRRCWPSGRRRRWARPSAMP